MGRPIPAPIGLARTVIRLVNGLNLTFGVLVFTLLVATLVAEGPVLRALGFPGAAENPAFVLGGRIIMVIGLASVPLAYLALVRLGEIVDTVRLGDPFVGVNARRLQTMAWALLGMELLHLVVGLVVLIVSTDAQPLDIDWNFSVTGWLAVLLLFVLARVFDHGARMREDLEGTV